MWQKWQFFMAKLANFCGKIWQNLGFQMAIFCDARARDWRGISQVKWRSMSFSNRLDVVVTDELIPMRNEHM